VRLECIYCFIKDIDDLLVADGELLGVGLLLDGVELPLELLVECWALFITFAFKHCDDLKYYNQGES
jgi:hypothetical protein